MYLYTSPFACITCITKVRSTPVYENAHRAQTHTHTFLRVCGVAGYIEKRRENHRRTILSCSSLCREKRFPLSHTYHGKRLSHAKRRITKERLYIILLRIIIHTQSLPSRNLLVNMGKSVWSKREKKHIAHTQFHVRRHCDRENTKHHKKNHPLLFFCVARKGCIPFIERKTALSKTHHERGYTPLMMIHPQSLPSRNLIVYMGKCTAVERPTTINFCSLSPAPQTFPLSSPSLSLHLIFLYTLFFLVSHCDEIIFFYTSLLVSPV